MFAGFWLPKRSSSIFFSVPRPSVPDFPAPALPPLLPSARVCGWSLLLSSSLLCRRGCCILVRFLLSLSVQRNYRVKKGRRVVCLYFFALTSCGLLHLSPPLRSGCCQAPVATAPGSDYCLPALRSAMRFSRAAVSAFSVLPTSTAFSAAASASGIRPALNRMFAFAR